MKDAHAEPVEVDVPLGIKMGDNLEYIVGLHNLEPIAGSNAYKLAPENNLPPMFEAIMFDSNDLTGIGRVRLFTRNYNEEGEDVYLHEWGDLLGWLNRKYGKGINMDEDEDSDTVDILWAGSDLVGPGERQHLGGNVSYIHLRGGLPNEDYFAISLIYAFLNRNACDEANQQERFRGI